MFHVEQFLAFSNTCRQNGLILSAEQVECFGRYASVLKEWNGKVNLVSRKDEENLWSSHILHSVAPLFVRIFPSQIRVLDIGTGGGLPGIPLAIANPGWSVTLLDSIGKKAAATQDIVTRLGLERADVVHGRAEDEAVLRKRKGKYDLVVARGVASLAQLAKWSRPYLRTMTSPDVGSTGSAFPLPSLMAYKGGDLDAELRELRIKVRGANAATYDIVFPGGADAGLVEKKLVAVQFT